MIPKVMSFHAVLVLVLFFQFYLGCLWPYCATKHFLSRSMAEAGASPLEIAAAMKSAFTAAGKVRCSQHSVTNSQIHHFTNLQIILG